MLLGGHFLPGFVVLACGSSSIFEIEWRGSLEGFIFNVVRLDRHSPLGRKWGV